MGRIYWSFGSTYFINVHFNGVLIYHEDHNFSTNNRILKVFKAVHCIVIVVNETKISLMGNKTTEYIPNTTQRSISSFKGQKAAFKIPDFFMNPPPPPLCVSMSLCFWLSLSASLCDNTPLCFGLCLINPNS